MTTNEDANKINASLDTNEDLANYIDSVIENLQNKVGEASTHINEKLEDMTTRINGLESSLNDILARLDQADQQTTEENTTS
ncbi:hypothetical protein BCR43DRAFT_486877 [Syncephalastrum racemosum]|uniref:Heat shock factor binding protein 1-domain-containing protein n=1 Tax=Syncephalastrum racemosum TaxID=13706 RepID=A0A1X2HPW9_SYNRA|nr:hypothetical protein BCR43DRAFT_486877 [Syncephalastrum racemosum]